MTDLCVDPLSPAAGKVKSKRASEAGEGFGDVTFPCPGAARDNDALFTRHKIEFGQFHDVRLVHAFLECKIKI